MLITTTITVVKKVTSVLYVLNMKQSMNEWFFRDNFSYTSDMYTRTFER